MKKIVQKFIAVFLISLLITSCSKKEAIDDNTQQIGFREDTSWKTYPIDTSDASVGGLQKIASVTTSYTSVPEINVYTPIPSTSVTAGGVIYYGGPFVMAVTSSNGNNVTVSVKRTDNQTFLKGSVLTIKNSSVSGNPAATVNSATAATVILPSTVSSYSFTLNQSYTWDVNGSGSSNPSNAISYLATWKNAANGLSFYTKPINVIAVPNGWGTSLGSFNNVSVYCNGVGGFSSTNLMVDQWGQKFQCVHYIQRYYSSVYQKNIGSGYAGDYWTNYTAHSLTRRILNGSGVPQMGDIICFSSSSGSNHVAIVAGVVSNTYLRCFQENVGTGITNAYRDFSFTKNIQGNYIVTASPLGSQWSVLGWVR